MARLDPINVKYWKLAHSPNDLAQETHADYACRCDICGDGHKSGSKRLHLFTKSNFDGDAVKCWNCGWTGNMWSYLSENHPALFTQYKRDKRSESFNEILTIQNLNETKSDEVELPDKISFDFGTATKDVTPFVPTPALVSPLDLQSLNACPEAVEYVRRRGIEPSETWLYSDGMVSFDGKVHNLKEYIIIPLLWDDGQWYGFQALAYKKKDFKVILLSDNFGWKVENWAFINKDEPVYIAESIYDRMSSGKKNSIAQMGASIHEDRLKELTEPIFIMDNQNIDEASCRESLNYLEKGYKVFIWPKGADKFKDFNDLRKRGVPYSKIESLIDNNIFQGMEGILKLKLL